MWFIFGIITLLCFFGYQVYKKLIASWVGTESKVDDLTYEYKFDYSKDDDEDDREITTIYIAIDAPDSLDFRLKKESATDRFFKKIGLSIEHQIGNSTFDDRIYLVSDNPKLHQLMSTNKILVDAILAFYSSKLFHMVNDLDIRCNSGRLWLKRCAPMGFVESDVDQMAQEVVPHLYTISEQLKKLDFPSLTRSHDPFIVKAALLLAASSGMLFNGIAQFYRIHINTIPFTVDNNQLLIDAVFWAIGLIVVLILITLFLLGRSSRTHLVLIELLLVGSLGAWLTASAQLRELNMESDESTANIYEVKVYEKRYTKSSRGGKTYYIKVDDWNDYDYYDEIQVSSSFYNSVTMGSRLEVSQKGGYLGYRWITKIEKIGRK